MKNRFLKIFPILTAIFLLFINFTQAQNFDGIAGAIRTGNASSIAANFQSNVEITIKDASNSYSKSQGEMVLKNFFSSHQPKSFSIAHEGTSPEGSKYFIGNLVTTAGNYRTYVYAKAAGGSLTIQEIRFEEQ
jgi:hypothetical protein